MRYLITGGCGFLGTNLAQAAIERGHDVVVFDNLSRDGSELNLEWLRDFGAFEFIRGDMGNPGDVEDAVSTAAPDVIFHVAGQVAMTKSITDPRRDFETNAAGTFFLLDAVRRLRPLAFVAYASSNKVYGDLEWVRYDESATRFTIPDYPNGFGEDLPFAPESPYGVSKGTADMYVRDFAKMYGMSTVVFRHSSIYGGRQYATADQGWITWFAEKVLEAHQGSTEELTISGTGKQVRDILHVEDVVPLYFAAAEAKDRIAGSILNIGGGMPNSISLLELLSFLQEVVGTRVNVRKLDQRLGDQRVFVADVTKATQQLGWEPTISARDGIVRVLDWLRHRPQRSGSG